MRYSMLFLPHGLHTKKVRFLNNYDYTACNHSSVKEQQRLLSISLTHMTVINMCYVQTGYN